MSNAACKYTCTFIMITDFSDRQGAESVLPELDSYGWLWFYIMPQHKLTTMLVSVSDIRSQSPL